MSNRTLLYFYICQSNIYINIYNIIHCTVFRYTYEIRTFAFVNTNHVQYMSKYAIVCIFCKIMHFQRHLKTAYK